MEAASLGVVAFVKAGVVVVLDTALMLPGQRFGSGGIAIEFSGAHGQKKELSSVLTP